MSINSIELASRMSDQLDSAVTNHSVTGFLADNVMQSKFVGAKTVLIPNVEFSGMGDYSRDDGFVQGSVNVENTAFELSMDRGRTLQLDAQDSDETGVADLAGKIMGEYVRTQVIPEIDAYTISKLATHATSKNQIVKLATDQKLETHAYKLLCDGADMIYDELGYEQELVCFVNGAFYKAIQSSPEFAKLINIADFKQGDINLKVSSINGITIRPVPSSRMKTAFKFNDGTSSGQTQGGFAPSGSAKDVGMLLMSKNAAMLVKKVEKTRVFSPDTNQKADAWKFDVRMYYDTFVKNSTSKGIVAYTI